MTAPQGLQHLLLVPLLLSPLQLRTAAHLHWQARGGCARPPAAAKGGGIHSLLHQGTAAANLSRRCC